LATGSLLALLVGALALVLLVVAELRDDAAELYAYEVDGIQPRSLRRLVFLRAVGVAVLALPVGVAAGSLLTRVTTQLIALTGAGGVPVPDLVPANGPATAGIVLLGGLALALILAALVVGVAMREPLPRPVRGDLG
jgi:ABC-type antimicrobial peptide transport system permease subunit